MLKLIMQAVVLVEQVQAKAAKNKVAALEVPAAVLALVDLAKPQQPHQIMLKKSLTLKNLLLKLKVASN